MDIKQMEIPIQVAVQVYPCYPKSLVHCVESLPINDADFINGNVNKCTGLVNVFRPMQNATVERIPFEIKHALPLGCSLEYLYRKTVQPMIGNVLEGFDVSIVTYGQQCTGKTYSMYGPGFDCVYGEPELGLVTRAVTEIYAQLMRRQHECRFSVNVAWIELNGNEIHDILGGKIVQCFSLNDVFQCLRIGWANRNPASHSLFTLTVEQKWIAPNGLIQHRLATVSFCDLVGTDRHSVNEFNEKINVPKDVGLEALDTIIGALSDPNCNNNENAVQYENSMLTKLLRDSFGGRAQTLMIFCVSPLEEDVDKTIQNLQLAYKTQFVRNTVLMNAFSDNNMPITNYIDEKPIEKPVENVGMKFAASQWLKLVSNAEGLFNKLLVEGKSLKDQDRECIEEWMYLKQECDECLSSAGLMMNPRLLGPIQETVEQSDDDEIHSESLAPSKCDEEIRFDDKTFSDSEAEDMQQLEERVAELMICFTKKMNETVYDKCDEFFRGREECDEKAPPEPEMAKAVVARGRRRSIQPTDNHPSGLSDSDIDRLKWIAEQGKQSQDMDSTLCREAVAFLTNSDHMHPLRVAKADKTMEIINEIRRVQNDIDAREKQIDELEQNNKSEQLLVNDLQNSMGERANAKRSLNRKESRLSTHKDKVKKMLSNCRDKREAEKLRTDLKQTEHQLSVVSEMQARSRESENQMKDHQKNVQKRKNEIQRLEKLQKKDKKTKEMLEARYKQERSKDDMQLDCVRKTDIAHKPQKKAINEDMVRHEIHSLRNDRDQMDASQRSLYEKLKVHALSEPERRKILEYDVAKEVIDHAIELKNQLICGRDALNRNAMFVGNPDLMSQLWKLPEKEMRILLYKCFQKIVDLRESSRQLEIQQMHLEHELDEHRLRERGFNQKLQQIHLQVERYKLQLQGRYEAMLTQLIQMAGSNNGNVPTVPTDQSIQPLLQVIQKQRHEQRISKAIGFGDFDQRAYRYAKTTATASKETTAKPHNTLLKYLGHADKRTAQIILPNFQATPEVTVDKKKIIIKQNKS